MIDLENQGDRAGAPTAAPEPEREWTDLQALARAVAQTKSREEAIALIASRDLPGEGRRDASARERETAAGSRAVAAACVPAPPRPRPAPRRGIGPLFDRRGGE